MCAISTFSYEQVKPLNFRPPAIAARHAVDWALVRSACVAR